MVLDYTREVMRKGVHLLSVFFIVIYFVFANLFGHKIGLFALAFLLVLLLELEYVRIEMKQKNIPILSKIWKLRRAKEEDKLGGEVLFLIGAIICLAIFDLKIAVAAILMTTFGDLAAALIGKKFGKHWIPRLKQRAWEGVIAELVVNLVVGFLFIRTAAAGMVWWMGGQSFGQPIWPIIIVMAVIATTVETLISKLDDNLLIPVFTGFAGQIALLILASFF